MSNTINIIDTFVLATDGDRQYLISLDRRANWAQLANLGNAGYELSHCTETRQTLGDCHSVECSRCKGSGNVQQINGELVNCGLCSTVGRTLDFSNCDNGLVTIAN